jgi:hypothetical protein
MLDTNASPAGYHPLRLAMSSLAFALALGAAALGPAPRDRVSTAGPAAPGSAEASPGPAPWIVQLRPHRNLWELGGFGGLFVIPTRHDLYDLDTAPQKPLRRIAPEAGLRAAYFPIGLVGVEGELGGVWSQVQRGGEPVFLWSARAHAVLQLPLYRIVPFVLGGYGLMGVRSPRDAVGSDVDPVGHLGTGVKLYLTRALALRLDGRWMLGAARASRRKVSHYGAVVFGLSITLGPGRAGTAR